MSNLKQRRKAHLEFNGDTLKVGTNVLAFLLNPLKPYSRETIGNWVKKGMPYHMRGKIKEFDFKEVYKWLMENENNLDALKAEQIKAQTAYSKKQAEYRDLQIKKEKKELISIDELTRSQVALVEFLKNQDNLFYTRCTDAKLKKELDRHYKDKWENAKNELEKIYQEQ